MATANGPIHLTRGAWRWVALAVVGAVVVAVAVVLLGQPQRAASAGAGSENATVADAYPLAVAASVLEGDTSGMAAGDGEGSSGGQRVWYRWRPADDDVASFAGAAYVLYEGGAAAPSTVRLLSGALDAAELSALTEVPATASDPAAGSYEFVLPSLAPGETFYIGVETGAPGDFLLSVWQPTPGGPANDDLGSAEALELVVNAHLDASGFPLAAGTTSYAGFEIDEDPAVAPEPNASATGGSVWYSWVVPQDGGRLEVSVASGAVALHAFEIPDFEPDPAVVEGIDAPIGGTPDAVEEPTAVGAEGGSQFDADRLVALPGADPLVLTGSLGDRFAIQVVGADDFALTGAVSGIDPPDTTAPVVVCTNDDAPTGGTHWARTWSGDVETPVSIECAVEDDQGLSLPVGSGADADSSELETPDWYQRVSETEAIVTLTASLPAGSASGAVTPDRVRQVCDRASNCVSVGLDVSVQIDNAAPALACDPAATGWRYGEDVGGGAVNRIACAATDAESGLAAAADAAFELVATLDTTGGPVEHAAVPHTTHAPVCDAAGNCTEVPTLADAMLDRKAPSVECGSYIVPASGWFHEDATVDCTAADAGSGLANAMQSTIRITTAVAAGTVDPAASSAPGQVCDVVGNCAELPRLTGVRVDRAAPSVACAPLAPWTRGTAIDLVCTAEDQADGAGLADPGADASFTIPMSIEAGGEASGLAPEARQVCDAAGNCAGLPALAGVGLDDRAPVVTCAAAPTGWLSRDATVACTAVDGGSGLADPALASFDLQTAFGGASTLDAAFVVSPTEVCDAVGNCAPVPEPATVRIDRVEPVVTCAKPVDGGYDFNVTVSCTASDADSGLAGGGSLDFLLRTSVVRGTAATGVQTNSREVCDLAGNCVVFGPYGDYDIDLTAAPAAPAPSIDAPGAVNVLAAVGARGFTGIRAPYLAPTVASEIGAVLDCTPDSTGIYPLGETEVSCTARDAADRVVEDAFPVRVTLAPDLAATQPIPRNVPIPVAGRGFSGPVGVEVAGVRLATLTPSGGAVAGEVRLPEDAATGGKTVVLRGTGADGDPLLVVKPVTITEAVELPAPDPGNPGGGDVPVPGGSGDADAGSRAPGGGASSPADRAEQIEEGFVLDPERWPTEEIEDGGDLRVDGDAAPPSEAAPALQWWLVALVAVLVVLASTGTALVVQRRRAR